MRIRKKPWARPELAVCPYYIDDPAALKGRWQERFGARRPLHLDLGCGKGVFLAPLARQNSGVNFLGIDLSHDILGVARRNIEAAYGEEAPDNVLITYFNIEQLGEILSPEDGVERLYINFCNPWPAARGHKKRLTHTRQLEVYLPLLARGGEIWFKTDNDDLYLATKRYFTQAGLEIFLDEPDLAPDAPGNILTEHELMFTAQGIRTKALRARKRA